MTTVINLRDHAAVAASIAAGRFVRCDRRTRYGNPFLMHDYKDPFERIRVVAQFRVWVFNSGDPRAIWIRQHVHELRDKDLGCHCYPLLCHCDVLAEMAEPHRGFS